MAAVNGIPQNPPSNPTAGTTSTPSGRVGTTQFSELLQAAQSHPHAMPSSASQAGLLQSPMYAAQTLPMSRPTGSSAHPNGPGHQQGAHNIHEQALGVHAYRMQLIASNIANADTPNYKAVDIDYREALRLGQAANTTATAAPSVHDNATANTIPIKYHVPQQGSVDGNTVELDVERAKFVDSTVRYEFSLDRVHGHYKMMMELLTNLKG